MRQLFLSFDGRIRTKDTRRPPHASPWWSRIISCRVADPWIGFWVSAFPEKHFLPSLLPVATSHPYPIRDPLLRFLPPSNHVIQTRASTVVFELSQFLDSYLVTFFASLLRLGGLVPLVSSSHHPFHASVSLLSLSLAIVLPINPSGMMPTRTRRVAADS